MNQSDARRLCEQLREIRATLQGAADDAALAHLTAQLALENPEVRAQLGDEALDLLVRLELALEALGRQRERLRKTQHHHLELAN